MGRKTGLLLIGGSLVDASVREQSRHYSMTGTLTVKKSTKKELPRKSACILSEKSFLYQPSLITIFF
ncbi:hypothetical protein OJAV_G00047420 [Oryzias javanicus]|uniref:Uncharacterized protein n=1 Tax=Oryzias javanicus TaxID=123683 RepID=A0A3S2PDY2_ORYJA|nr:hypothetical protein OJAV_G00047420 [Oryzias javanicus]